MHARIGSSNSVSELSEGGGKLCIACVGKSGVELLSSVSIIGGLLLATCTSLIRK